jgi:serine/threonine-protein kinase
MAPEIIHEGVVDHRADVYALGSVAYFLLTGQLVFEADSAMKMFLQHLQVPPMRPSERTEMPIPRELEQVVMTCLEKEPAKRPQSAEQLLRMLETCQTRGTWDNGAAKRWWERHLLELTGPLAA